MTPSAPAPAAPPRRTVLVTGAAGCVGAFVVDELLARGHRVVASDRPGAPAAPARAGLEWRAADLTEPAAADPLCAGVDAVIHTAAWVDIAAPFAAQAPINLDAVRFLHQAAARAGVAHFVHFSTGSIYAPKDGPITEDDPLLPTSSYERAKLLAEDYLRAQPPAPLVTILRPTLIYGPRGKVLLAALATVPALLHRLDGWLPRLRGGPRLNLVHAHDVARAAVHLLERRPPHLATFNVATPEVLDAGELVATALRTAGLTSSALEVRYPWRLLRAVLPLLEFPQPFVALNRATRALWHWVTRNAAEPDALAPRLDMEMTVYLGGDTVFDVARLVATGFEFRYPTFEAGWRQTLEWYAEHHWIPALPADRTLTSGAAAATAELAA